MKTPLPEKMRVSLKEDVDILIAVQKINGIINYLAELTEEVTRIEADTYVTGLLDGRKQQKEENQTPTLKEQLLGEIKGKEFRKDLVFLSDVKDIINRLIP